MKLLLDTHIVVWLALEPSTLSQDEQDLLASAETVPILSAVSVWELRLKWHRLHVSGERKGPVSPASVVAFAEALDWEFLPLTAHHATAGLAAPLAHTDPCDELLLVQAQEEGLRLLTRDSKLAHHPLAIRC